MNCGELLRRLADAREGAADACLCDEIERHLAECAPCDALREDLEALARLCRDAKPPRLPEAVRGRIARMLRDR